MKCSIIKDLLPSYIDGICSCDSIEAIEKHMQTCKECAQLLEAMKQTILVDESAEERQTATHPFYRIRKQKIRHITIAILITIAVMISGLMVIQDVGIVHDFFYPRKYVTVRDANPDTAWKTVLIEDWDTSSQVNHNHDYLNLNSWFYQKKITNHANSESIAELRILDTNGTVILDNICIPPGTSYPLDVLQRNTNYQLQLKNIEGDIFLTIS